MESLYSNKLRTLVVTLLSLFVCVDGWCQQNIVTAADGTQSLVPTSSAPAFGEIIDYEAYPQLTDIPSMYITVYKTTVTEDADGSYTYTVDKTQTMDVSTTKYDWYYQCNIVIADQYGNMKQINQDVGLRGRGNSTWTWTKSEKRPFRLKFNAKTKLLANYDMTLGKEYNDYANSKNWTLLANAFDKTLIHNAFTYELGHNKLTNLAYCPAYRFVDLYINKVYFGTYQISDNVQVASDKVNVDSDTGWFTEILGNTTFEEEPYTTDPIANIKNPEDATSSTATYKAIAASLKSYYDACANKSGYKNLVDVNSLIDWVIGEEIAGNYDGTYGNVYHYREAENDKWHVGPMWDLDIAYGGYGSMAEKHIWQSHGSGAMDFMLSALWTDPAFVKALYERWTTIYNSGALKTWTESTITTLGNLVNQSQAKSYATATPFGASPQSISTADNMGGSFESYDAALSYFKTWTTTHIDWLNSQYQSQYDNLGCADYSESEESEETATGLSYLGTGKIWGYGEESYSYVGSAKTMVEGATLTITLEGSGAYFSALADNQYTAWLSTYGGSPLTYTHTLTAEDVTKLMSCNYTIKIAVYSGTCQSVTLAGGNTPAECTTHDYTDYTKYAVQPSGTYHAVCKTCGYENTTDTYYCFTVYPESAASETVYAKSWKPSNEHPNSIAYVKITSGMEATIPDSYNVFNTTKNNYSEQICPDFRLTDGHPYYSPNKFVATKATYTRELDTDEEYGTIILPYKYQNASNNCASFYHISSVSGSTMYLKAIDPDTDGDASAYTPVVFKRTNGANNITVTGTNITVKKSSANKISSTLNGWMLTGVMEQTTVVGDTLYQITDAENGKIEKVSSVNVEPFRAYFSTTSGATSPFTFSISGSAAIDGDANGDGVVTIEDVTYLISKAIKGESTTTDDIQKEVNILLKK